MGAQLCRCPKKRSELQEKGSYVEIRGNPNVDPGMTEEKRTAQFVQAVQQAVEQQQQPDKPFDLADIVLNNKFLVALMLAAQMKNLTETTLSKLTKECKEEIDLAMQLMNSEDQSPLADCTGNDMKTLEDDRTAFILHKKSKVQERIRRDSLKLYAKLKKHEQWFLKKSEFNELKEAQPVIHLKEKEKSKFLKELESTLKKRETSE